MIGVICTCAPAFNKAFQDNLPQFEALASRLRSSLLSSKQGYSKSYGRSSHDYDRRDSDQNSGARMNYAHRTTVEKATESQGHELRPASSFRTFIGGGSEGFATKESGIHKKCEVVQERSGGVELNREDKQERMRPAAVEYTPIA